MDSVPRAYTGSRWATPTSLFQQWAGHPHLVVDAEEAGPAADLDTWWNTKQSAFGGDDGVVFLERAFAEGLPRVQQNGRVCIDLTPATAKVAIPTARQNTKSRGDPDRTARNRRQS